MSNITRLIYFSENQIDPAGTSMLRELSGIMSASNRNNQASGLTGALVVDDRWFIQILEGDRGKIWQTFRRIEEDERHSDVVVVEARPVDARIFGNWWMGIATRNAQTEDAFARHSRKGLLQPARMDADAIISLARDLATIGLSRKVALAA